MKQGFYILIFAISTLLLIQCAQQSAPTGGVKDTNPPILDTTKAQNTIPKNLSTNFTSKTITLYFNEYIKLNQPKKNIITTPEIKEIDYFLRGKKLLITIYEELRENTTYTINLSEGVQDITEGNKMQNFSYVFSTGNSIDSLTCSGKVIDAFTKIPLEEVTVMLYSSELDTSSKQVKPLYFTKTDKTGAFNFHYLKEGKYSIKAVLDENNNLKVEANEKVAFIDSFISIDTTKKSILLKLFSPEKKKQFIETKSMQSDGKIKLILNKPTPNITVSTSPKNNLIEYSEKNDTITIWFDSLTLLDQTSIETYLIDSSNNFTDTIKLQTPKKFDFKSIRLKNSFGKGQNYRLPIKLNANQPLVNVNPNKIVLTIDSVQQEIEVNDSSRFVFIQPINNKNLLQDQLYTLQLLPGAIEGLYNKNDSIEWAFNTTEDLDYGSINLNLKSPKNNYILQLIFKGKVVREQLFFSKEFAATFNYLLPGDYQIRLIFDSNKNGKWDTGDLDKKTQPEQVEYYNEQLNIRAGWDLDVSWQIVK